VVRIAPLALPRAHKLLLFGLALAALRCSCSRSVWLVAVMSPDIFSEEHPCDTPHTAGDCLSQRCIRLRTNHSNGRTAKALRNLVVAQERISSTTAPIHRPSQRSAMFHGASAPDSIWVQVINAGGDRGTESDSGSGA